MIANVIASQVRLIITNSIRIFSTVLDMVIECTLEDADQPSPTMMNVTIVSPQRSTGEPLVLQKISPLEWKHNDGIDLYVSVISLFFK